MDENSFKLLIFKIDAFSHVKNVQMLDRDILKELIDKTTLNVDDGVVSWAR